jgi:hypothetical protein
MGGYPAVFPSDWCGDHKLEKEAMKSMVVGPPEGIEGINSCAPGQDIQK